MSHFSWTWANTHVHKTLLVLALVLVLCLFRWYANGTFVSTHENGVPVEDVSYRAESRPSRKGSIISDSICRLMRNTSDLAVFAFPGFKIEGLAELIAHNHRLVLPYQTVILHVGTNDISLKSGFLEHRLLLRGLLKEAIRTRLSNKKRDEKPVHSVDILEAEYRRLIATVKSIKPTVRILISSVLPRPFDFGESQPRVDELNRRLTKIADETACVYLPSNLLFQTDGAPKTNLFSDGLHLTEQGRAILHGYLTKMLLMQHL